LAEVRWDLTSREGNSHHFHKKEEKTYASSPGKQSHHGKRGRAFFGRSKTERAEMTKNRQKRTVKEKGGTGDPCRWKRYLNSGQSGSEGLS